ncbi:secreted frizzled-related protein 5-like [Neocloeon triangulifer]|uniref:secreted frizzled-related protein 5-like n=1 Tax=Neocloeon triangulifer TaxID=2078957 RepID=UPI00286F3826|nr:secreted frizzled-related protein 5-like [Neocloeon triangulifer]
MLARLVLVLAVVAAAPPAATASYLGDWPLSGRASHPTCVDIPRNMSLCHGIGYHKMRLPNLLDHDTMAEVSHQASSWVPLLGIKCHSGTQLFLCSLFSPVCLERTIYPCRSLCEKVKQGCEDRMLTYGFPWPDMLKCEKFPLDNDMCISPQSINSNSSEADKCQACNQPETYENILDNFCRADFAVRTKFRKVRKNKLMSNKAKVLKGPTEKPLLRQLRKPTFTLHPSDTCCEDIMRGSREFFLVMGHFREGKMVPSFAMPWAKDSKAFKRALKMFKSINCSDPKLVSQLVIVGEDTANANRRKRGKMRRKKPQQKPPRNGTRTQQARASSKL